MNARVEAVLDMAKTWPTEDQAELLDAPFGLVSPVDGELEAQWVDECEDRCAAIDSGEMRLSAADLVMAKYRHRSRLRHLRQGATPGGGPHGASQQYSKSGRDRRPDMQKVSTSKADQDIPGLKREQLGTGVREKYFQHFTHGSNVAELRPGIQKTFPTSEAVNNALTSMLAFAQEAKNLTRLSKRATRKRAAVKREDVQHVVICGWVRACPFDFATRVLEIRQATDYTEQAFSRDSASWAVDQADVFVAAMIRFAESSGG